MAVTAQRARTLALSLEGASSYPHFNRLAFRTERRTFATLALDGADLNFMCDLVEQQRLCELAPQAITPVPGGWGRMGWTRIDLKKIDVATFTSVLKGAHARANAPRTRKKPPAAATKPRLVAATKPRKKATRK
jgi:hypothetical protein